MGTVVFLGKEGVLMSEVSLCTALNPQKPEILEGTRPKWIQPRLNLAVFMYRGLRFDPKLSCKRANPHPRFGPLRV